ncbi:hypothetical protein DPMN_116985 [Dreissena polymorpha]|uniref:Uncharacterized protein n=1 Tax=Dreissena polymorpha TaxID=45954 RepID=A0A9D4QUR8_DREPO|nr:hypothetical protein DPMN_116985 [Dreissena polymorpha]
METINEEISVPYVEKLCAQCLDEIPNIRTATGFCRQCKEFICSDPCLRQHAKFRLTKTHRFVLDDGLKAFLKNFQNVGEASLQNKESESADESRESKRVPTILQAVLRTEYNFRADIDREICSVHASAVIASGHIVLVDLKNSNIKLFNPEIRKCMSVLKFEGGPRDLCVSNKNPNEVYVAKKGVRGIHHVTSTRGVLAIKETIGTEGECSGIACIKDGLAVTTTVNKTYYGQQELRLLEYRGRVKRRFSADKYKQIAYNMPWYLCSNMDGQRVLMSDFGNHTITCVDIDGDVIFVFKDPALLRPASLASDANFDIFAVSQRGHCVHHISQDGAKKGVIYSEKMMEFPGGIAFDYTVTSRFYLQCTGWSDTIQVFDLVTDRDP